MATIFDLTSKNGLYSLVNKPTPNSNRNMVGNLIGKAENFADSISVDKCYQFGESSMAAIAGLGGECSTNIMDMIGDVLKNNAIAKFINVNIKKVYNAIDSVKSFGSSVASAIGNSSPMRAVKGFYCGVMAPAMQILLMILNSLISIPLSILRAIYKFIQRVMDVASSTVNKLFDCLDAYLNGMADSVGEIDAKFGVNFKLSDLFSFMDGIGKFLENCEVISRPLINTFNSIVDPCSSMSLRPVFNAIGMTSSSEYIPPFCAASDVRSFLKRRKNIKDLSFGVNLGSIISKLNPLSGIFKGAKALSEISRTYSAYGIAKLHSWLVRPIHKLESMYNNLLSTESRLLGLVVNSLMGWLLPNCGSSKFRDGRIRRRKYSINDVVNILDSMGSCNTYICGNISNRVAEILEMLETNKWGKWINPLVNANESVNKMLDNLFVNTFGSNSDISKNNIKNDNIDMNFIKSTRPYSLSLAVVA